MSLPKKIMILFIVSGTTFVAGAIGFEMLCGRHHALYGKNDLVYSIFYTCEEFLEMLGIVIFIYTLLLYIASQFKLLTISIQGTNRGSRQVNILEVKAEKKRNRIDS